MKYGGFLFGYLFYISAFLRVSLRREPPKTKPLGNLKRFPTYPFTITPRETHPKWVCRKNGGHNLWLRFRVDEHPFATYFDVQQGYKGLGFGLTASSPYPSDSVLRTPNRRSTEAADLAFSAWKALSTLPKFRPSARPARSSTAWPFTSGVFVPRLFTGPPHPHPFFGREVASPRSFGLQMTVAF